MTIYSEKNKRKYLFGDMFSYRHAMPITGVNKPTHRRHMRTKSLIRNAYRHLKAFRDNSEQL